MSSINSYIQKLVETAPLRENVIRAAIKALKLPSGSKGLDAGCGIGLHLPMLAEAIGANGHITGLDLSAEFLEYAKKITDKSGLSKQISFQAGDVSDLPFDNDTFDWVWSVDCVGYAPMELLPLLNELTRVVKPGGAVAILAWSSQMLLPGYPILEVKLNATSSGIAPFKKSMNPDRHFYRTLGWFRQAGLTETKAWTFAGDVHAPFGDDMRHALESFLEMRWVGVESELTPEDWSEFQRLCQPDSPDFILNLSDYYTLFTYSMFTGQVVQ